MSRKPAGAPSTAEMPIRSFPTLLASALELHYSPKILQRIADTAAADADLRS